MAYRWLKCPRKECGDIIGSYSKDLEEQRKVENFKSWCPTCEHVVTPLYI